MPPVVASEAVAVAAEAVDLTPVAALVARQGVRGEGAVISLLQGAQEIYGWLPRSVMDEIARLSGIPVAKLYGVATFYAQFYLAPHGKHTVRLCRGTACHVRGAPQVLAAVERHLGVEDGATTADRLFSLETVACLGTCFLSPAMLVGQSQYFGRLTPERAVRVLEDLRAQG